MPGRPDRDGRGAGRYAQRHGMENQMTSMQALFTDSYSKFTRWVSRIEVRKEANEQKAKIRVPEKTVRCIWNDQLFKIKN